MINKIRVKSSFNRELTDSIFNFVFDEIKRIIINEKNFDISDLGEFDVIHRKMQTVTDVNKRAEILLPPKDKLIFRPSKELINRLKD